MSRKIEMLGNRYGHLTVVGEAENTNAGQAKWKCQCDCGNTTIVRGQDLRNGKTQSCGCKYGFVSPKFENLAGKRFGKWEVISRAENDKTRKTTKWICKCECGNIKTLEAYTLKSGNSKSCGCARKGNIIHGLGHTRLYRIYCNMKQRCYNPKNSRYHCYGKRGIRICDEWLENFEKFYYWAINNGYTDELTIDRIDVNGIYEPSNCRWATMLEQAKNKQNSRV